MTTQQLAPRDAPGQLAAASPIDRFRLLDAFTGGLVEPRKQQPTLATVSAGYNANAGKRGEQMKPVVSRDGTIYVNGRENLALAFEQVPGLAKALQATNRKRLTITFPFDEPELFIQQHFACRSASRLQVYGDHTGLTRIRTEDVDRETGEKTNLPRPLHEFYPAGSEEFEKLLPYVKVETNIYFFLADWEGREPRVLMPDGLGLYRLRMTSRNSAHGIVNSLKWISQLTGGRFAGVPFDLWHEQMEVPGPDGRRRNVPVWQLIPRPPEALALTSGNFRQIFSSALIQGEQLKILPPPDRTIDVAALDGPAYDAPLNDGPSLEGPEMEDEAEERPSVTPAQQAAFNAAMRGGLCDPARARRRFFGDFGDTVLNDEGPRATMMREYSKGSYSSLGAYLADCTEGEASNLMAFAKLWLARKAEAERPRRVIEGRSAPISASGGLAPATPVVAPEEPAESASGGLAESLAAAEPMLPGLADEAVDAAASDGTEQPGDQIWEDEPEAPDVDLDDVLPARNDDEDLDLLSLHVQRRESIERATTLQDLEMAWHDCQRDSDLLGKARTMLLTRAYEKRKGELGAAR